MTNYSLEEFIAWLEAKPERKKEREGLNWGTCAFIENEGGLAECIAKRGENDQYAKVIRQWMQGIDKRERERERANEEENMPFKNCVECGAYKQMPPIETLCYTCRERRDNMVNPLEAVCRQCYQFRSAITNNLCANCDFYNKDPAAINELFRAEVEGIVPQLQRQIQELGQEIKQLKNNWVLAVTNLDKAREQIDTNQQALQEKTTELQTSQELTVKLQQDNRDLLNDIHQYKQKITSHEQTINSKQQRIIALEADKTDLLSQFTQTQQEHQQYLNQEKTYLTQEIQLIKEVIYV